MLKSASVLLLSFFALFVFVGSVFAAGFELTHIGTVSTGGNRYSQWWYQSANPTFKGTADPSATVTLTLGTENQSTTADATGNWTITPTTAATGEHDVSISSGEDLYVFTLTIGTEAGTTATQSSTISSVPSDVPATGAIEITIALLGGALALLAIGFGLNKISA